MLSKHIYKIAVNLMPALNRVSMLPFWEAIGGFQEFTSIPQQEWESLCLNYGVKPEKADREIAIKSAMGEAVLMEKYRINLLCYDDYNYPTALLECPDAPLVLYYKGSLFADSNHLAIVGTRAASRDCKEIISEIVGQISQCENPPIIVSGLAHGIDVCAQKAAVESGLRTYAVLAHGLGTIYPAANRDIATQILEKGLGAVLSEYPCNKPADKFQFLERNRIIAGMSRWLLVGESSLKGGSMVTAKIAFSYGREIMAIPGSPTNSNAQGCNQLIKHNMAYLIENGKDVVEILGLNKRQEEPELSFNSIQLSNEEKLVLLAIKRNGGPIHINDIGKASGVESSNLPFILLNLEMNSLIKSLPGNTYKIYNKG